MTILTKRAKNRKILPKKTKKQTKPALKIQAGLSNHNYFYFKMCFNTDNKYFG